MDIYRYWYRSRLSLIILVGLTVNEGHGHVPQSAKRLSQDDIEKETDSVIKSQRKENSLEDSTYIAQTEMVLKISLVFSGCLHLDYL